MFCNKSKTGVRQQRTAAGDGSRGVGSGSAAQNSAWAAQHGRATHPETPEILVVHHKRAEERRGCARRPARSGGVKKRL